MSGVYIQGMKMPKYCEECFFFTQDCGGICCISQGEGCPLVTIPPHGRLIDADGEVGVNVTMMPGGKCRVDLIAPTIIPASTEGE